MFARKRKAKANFAISSNSTANRHRRMRKNLRKKVLNRQNIFIWRAQETEDDPICLLN